MKVDHYVENLGEYLKLLKEERIVSPSSSGCNAFLFFWKAVRLGAAVSHWKAAAQSHRDGKPKGTSGLRETWHLLEGRVPPKQCLGYYLWVCVNMCARKQPVFNFTETMTDCCMLIVSPSIKKKKILGACVSAQVWGVCIPCPGHTHRANAVACA